MDLSQLFDLPWPPVADPTRQIPWGEREFSERVLREHLRQDTPNGSRPDSDILFAVEEIYENYIEDMPLRVLDLGCGPGLYLDAFRQWGVKGRGIDISPAAVDYAQSRGLDVTLGDIRTARFGRGYGVVTMLYSEINVFSRREIVRIMEKARNAAVMLILEFRTIDGVVDPDRQIPTWELRDDSPFCSVPHLLLDVAHLDEERLTLTNRWIAVETATSRMHVYESTEYGYSDDEMVEMAMEAGWEGVWVKEALSRTPDPAYRTLVGRWSGGREE